MGGIGVERSGKAPVFGTGIKGSNHVTPKTKVVELVDTLGLGSSS